MITSASAWTSCGIANAAMITPRPMAITRESPLTTCVRVVLVDGRGCTSVDGDGGDSDLPGGATVDDGGDVSPELDEDAAAREKKGLTTTPEQRCRKSYYQLGPVPWRASAGREETSALPQHHFWTFRGFLTHRGRRWRGIAGTVACKAHSTGWLCRDACPPGTRPISTRPAKSLIQYTLRSHVVLFERTQTALCIDRVHSSTRNACKETDVSGCAIRRWLCLWPRRPFLGLIFLYGCCELTKAVADSTRSPTMGIAVAACRCDPEDRCYRGAGTAAPRPPTSRHCRRGAIAQCWMP